MLPIMAILFFRMLGFFVSSGEKVCVPPRLTDGQSAFAQWCNGGVTDFFTVFSSAAATAELWQKIKQPTAIAMIRIFLSILNPFHGSVFSFPRPSTEIHG
jgi:hypothetical protein